MTNRFEKILNEIKDSQELICIYRNHNQTDSFYVGLIKGIDDKNILMEVFDKKGERDGYVLFRKSMVFLVETQNEYIRKIQEKITKPSDNRINSIESFWDNLVKGNLLTEIELLESGFVDVRGCVLGIQEGILQIRVMTDDEQPDGEAFCAISDISKIDMII
ncbi:MAG: hypothetical protein K6G65_09875 [Lachnospiraceae bacterium]|nr:hypothetical protein [Lachnospiraceae bacterium]